MDHFDYRDGRLYAERMALSELAARFGTPQYVYSRAALEQQWHAFDRALGARPHRVCYAVKANSNLAVLDTLARLGSGFDIVSVGELERCLAVGADPAGIVYSGVAKRAEEMGRALEVGIGCFNVESAAELERLAAVAAARGAVAPVALRVNPDVDPATHPYIATGLRESKFGIAIDDAAELFRSAAASPHLAVTGVDCHIGSQLTDVQPFVDALTRVLALCDQLAAEGIAIGHLDLGGGFGIRYRDEQPPAAEDWARAIERVVGDADYEIRIEPGRAIAGNAGVLLTRVDSLKGGPDKTFAIVDAAMNDLIRPALYDAWHDIVAVEPRGGAATRCDIVGPVCESGDFLGQDRELALAAGDLLAVCSAGAYGFVMASNYNSRPRPPEVMVDGAQAHLVRPREALADLWAGESLLPRETDAAAGVR
ncbi:MAG: diaminopimelate decarboxylase [Halofilum sp. (in: g-proteobacteria)]